MSDSPKRLLASLYNYPYAFTPPTHDTEIFMSNTPDVNTEEKKKNPLGDVSVIQVLAGALAAVTAAFVGTKLGLSGTIIGAAVGSIVATIGSAIYSQSLQHGKKAVQKAQILAVGTLRRQDTLVSVPAGDSLPTPAEVEEESTSLNNDSDTQEIPSIEDRTSSTEEETQQLVAQELSALEMQLHKPWYKRLDWKHVIITASISLFISLGAIALLQSLSDKSANGLTINRVVVETPSPTPPADEEPDVVYVPTPVPETDEAADEAEENPAPTTPDATEENAPNNVTSPGNNAGTQPPTTNSGGNQPGGGTSSGSGSSGGGSNPSVPTTPTNPESPTPTPTPSPSPTPPAEVTNPEVPGVPPVPSTGGENATGGTLSPTTPTPQ